MISRTTSTRTYLFASLLSVIVNAGAVGTFATIPNMGIADPREDGGDAPLVLTTLSEPEPPTPPEPPNPTPEVTPPPPPIALGNPDAPDSPSKVWLGVSKDANDGGGEKGRVEQAEFKQGAPGAPNQEPRAESTPSDAEDAPPEPPAEGDEREVRDSRFPEPTINAPTPAEPRESMAAPVEVDPDGALPPEKVEAIERRIEAMLVSTPRSTSAKAAPTPRPAPTGEGGANDDRDADGLTISEVVIARPGRPLAARGLQIKTVTPRWTVAARLMWGAKDPMVRVKFGRTGRVIHADYVPGHGAGHPDIAGPLLDAIYRWTAEGKELAKIPASPPDAGITVTFQIMLH